MSIQRTSDHDDSLASTATLAAEPGYGPPTQQSLLQVFSPVAARLLQKHAIAERKILATQPEDLLKKIFSDHHWESLDDLPSAERLRNHLVESREQLWLHLCAHECLADYPLEKAMSVISEFADNAICMALEYLTIQASKTYGQPIGNESHNVVELTVLALGRLGEREMSPACDVDLVFVYEEEGKTNGTSTLDNRAYFSNIVSDLWKILGPDSSGQLVLRLFNNRQPGLDKAPLACSTATLERHIATHLDEGERSVWISARALIGPTTPLDKIIHPFVFRRFLDYTVFQTLRGKHNALRREITQAGLDNNLRLGPGGLREIECLIQTFCLIRGGRDSRLRVRSTLIVLDAMVHRREMPKSASQELSSAYVFLRRLEHRLQYMADSFTHTLPESQSDLAALAQTMAIDNATVMTETLNLHRNAIQHHFNSVFTQSPDEGADILMDVWNSHLHQDGSLELLRECGHQDPAQSLAHLNWLRKSSAYLSMNAQGRRALDNLIPNIIRHTGEHLSSAEVLRRVCRVFEALPEQPVYFGLLAQYPSVLERLIRFCAASPWIANFLAMHPILLDELLYPNHLIERMDSDALKRSLSKILDNEGNKDESRQIELMCEFRQTHTFRLVAREQLLGITPRELGKGLSILADSILSELLERVWLAMETEFGPMPRFGVIAYGKYGSRELSYASDLDLVFVYDDTHEDAQRVYTRLGKRMLNWLNTTMPAGILYEVDMRLRPDGESGVLVPTIETLDHYLQNRAWTWEHQALTRARFVVGHPEVGNKFEEIRQRIVCKPRELTTLKAEVLNMRDRISEEKQNKGDLFGLKHDRGGLVDVEFTVQYLVLAYGNQHPELAQHLDNADLLELAGELGLLDVFIARAAANAYNTLRQLQHSLRLQGHAVTTIEHEKVAPQIDAIRSLWNKVFK
ncbi:MAG: bifunctional [glutamate--ammonia ligase]-adenylyl-L-tyrosine phosphorylase/[glutamate--ammonia-ligase] adenylyltransferase [Rhodocyclaceae bacterium]|nr:bifunctional [glutamate--ammonia ligase]-adenylyl-L-tyrosine phosphorylase/[glutamate--ammonia-ligase] adenylyltransferase [Rhodocyclaceae bacterium]